MARRKVPTCPRHAKALLPTGRRNEWRCLKCDREIKRGAS